MADAPLWIFRGYCTPAGNWDVQDWFDGLPWESKDEIRDTIAYLEHLPGAQWRGPEFKGLGEGLSEIRCKVTELGQVLRIYGTHGPYKSTYTLLLGTAAKKVRNDAKATNEARKRLARVNAKTVGTHEFRFSENTN